MLTNMHVRYSAVLLCFSIAIASISVKRTGWLDRLVAYHKNMFLKDVEKLTPIQINASIERIPPGYVDSPNWNYESVLKLLILIRESKTAKPVHIALRRMLRPSRRFMNKKDSYKHFPSLKKYYTNEFYYDSEEKNSVEYEERDVVDFDENGLIMVTNPVEARLPSGQISIKLLKEIMEARAAAARVLPETSKAPPKWKPFVTPDDDRPSGGGDAGSGGGGDAGGGAAGGGDAGSSAAGGGDAGGGAAGGGNADGGAAGGGDAGSSTAGGGDAGGGVAGGDNADGGAAGGGDAGGGDADDAAGETGAGTPADTGTSAANPVTVASTDPQP